MGFIVFYSFFAALCAPVLAAAWIFDLIFNIV